MFRNVRLSVAALLALSASTAVFAGTGAAYQDKNGDTVQNQTSEDGKTREETRWRKDGRYVSKTTYVWDGCAWKQKDFHYWKKIDGVWHKDSADKLINGPAGDVPNGGTAPTSGAGSGAASSASANRSASATSPASNTPASATAIGQPVHGVVRPPNQGPRPIRLFGRPR
ncbi:MAG TPA: hypothetical protein VGZ47_07455 [Gemmataceae bacterium]|jgi:hypothetical protein|nr:hypothetical protein [Gemmataceae bacterium]